MGRRKDLSLAEKIAVLSAHQDEKKTQTELARQFGISRPQVSKIIKDKEALEVEYKNGNQNRKCKRGSKAGDVDQTLWLWFQQMQLKGLPINAALLKEKAMKLAGEKGIPDFTSEGWLSRWKIRHNLVFKKICGESKDSDTEAAASWVTNVLPGLVKNFSPDAVYNCDETVKSTTVVNCFKQCKFPATADEPAEEEPERSETLQASDEDPPFGMTQEEFLLYVECDENVDVCGEFSDAELLQMVRQDQDKSDEDENHPEDGKETEAPPSNSEALKLLHRLRLYVDSTGVSALDEIYQLESKVPMQPCEWKEQHLGGETWKCKEAVHGAPGRNSANFFALESSTAVKLPAELLSLI
ncbi:unnamed protein product [Darwinula stevensoni]|uniref:HTH CENPB-type domain-containing protein n=1 Tax=Darwinula stevensoni TaxID=69355 RepID=A0A7R9FNL7_9CRUS|nr:unnamed protein product [Darwinula stevensoni]CAG0896950.1 unnamed protein product [Darwinula stevensoni]